MTSSRAGAVIVAALLALLLVPSAVSADVAVAIQADGISPDPVVVDVAEAIRFTNDTDDVVRLVDDMQRWDSGDLRPGETFVFTFNVDGVFTFTSEDGAIAGTILVGDVEAPDDAVTEGPDGAGDAGAPDEGASDDGAPDDGASDDGAGAGGAVADPPTTPDALATTGLPSARIAWLAALSTLAGIVILRRTEARR